MSWKWKRAVGLAGLLLVGMLGLEKYAVPPRTVGELMRGEPQTLVIYTDTRQLTYQDRDMIDRVHEAIYGQEARRVSQEDSMSVRKGREVAFSYNSDKSNVAVVDERGAICVSVDKGEIRNKSRLHWLWWRLDAEQATYIAYCTQPNRQVAEVAQDLKAQAERQ